jgi:peptidoglycan/xylan/chitin deacetylase (PgdA/CDA1 family)
LNLAMTLRAKGGAGMTARVRTILTRFGATPRRMERGFERYLDITRSFDARPTLPITASVLNRHAPLARRFAGEGIEFAVHGLVHNDHRPLDYAAQRTSITRAATLFRHAGIDPAGFRAPYLRANEATDDVLRGLGFGYHSSRAVAYPVLPPVLIEGARGDAWRRILDFYSARDAGRLAVRPHDRRGLIDIPVCIPDDEILIDRYHCTNEIQTAVWLAILEKTRARGDLFTVQLHPERIFDCEEALRAVLAEARGRGDVWIARLDEIAAWWRRRSCASLDVREVAPGRYRIEAAGDADVTLLTRGLPGAGSSIASGAFANGRSHAFEVDLPLRPVVGLSSRSGAAATFLREEGYPVEMSDERRDFAVYLDVPGDDPDEAAILDTIERSTVPLVRLGRWPQGARSALAVTGDIDSITLQDFALRLWETRARRGVRLTGTPARVLPDGKAAS